MSFPITSPYPLFLDLQGDPLQNGSLYFGVVNQNPETAPTTVYWDSALTQPAAQPISTVNGFPVRSGTSSQLFIGVDYSITVRDSTGALVSSALSSTVFNVYDSSNIVFVPYGTGAVATTVQTVLRENVAVTRFTGVDPTGALDSTVGLQASIDANVPLTIPPGIYKYSVLTGLGRSGLKITGAGSALVTLLYTGSGDAFKIDGGGAFIQGLEVGGFSIKGNTATTSLLYLRDVARSTFKDINVYEANNAAGIGFNFLGVQLNYFENLYCSQDRQAMSFPPYNGLYMAVSGMLLNSTNNTFVHCYTEGGVTAGDMKIGMYLQSADQNTFIGGSSESQRTYGLIVSTGSKMNTFIGTGFESVSSTADVIDSGLNNSYINCYASKSIILQGSRSSIKGGYYERIQIDSGAIRNTIDSPVINHWASGSGGLFDSGTGTTTRNVYDTDATAYKTDIRPRFLANAPADVLNQTGNGAQATVGFSEIFDDNNNFASNTFTAPITGRYQLDATVSLSVLTTAATLSALRIVTSNRTYLTQKGLNPKAGGLQDAMAMSVVADMDAGDTATVTIQVDGMAGNTVTVIGNATTMWTTFSGSLV